MKATKRLKEKFVNWLPGNRRAAVRLGSGSFGPDDVGPFEMRMRRESKMKAKSRAAQGWQTQVGRTWRDALDIIDPNTNAPKYRKHGKSGAIWRVRPNSESGGRG